ncbi:ABC transporter permease (plasmid) [Pararhizobium polonicum]|uniref:ABC transporter permease n=1 Tax=Pararhizobium polonicum TaxID=1612624 RepID=A0A1C7P8K8_9HYPH|nr:ABC transporter permease [Pararhizobium polonicum]OBZ97603.1 ABC transporter permease [Pararhizobium polonicum]
MENQQTSRASRLLMGRGSRQGLWALPLILAVLMSFFLAFATAQFANSGNLSNLVAQGMPLMITAIGQMFVVLVGGLDLSVGSVVSFTTAILALDAPAYVVLPAVFILAGVIGFINGFCITRLKVHPIIATLSMQYVVLGITRILRPVSGGSIPEFVTASVAGSIAGIPMPVIWGVVTIAIAWKLLYGSRYGLHIFAIGGGVAAGSTEAARNFGIPARRNIMLAYVISALFAALAGVFLAGRIVSGDPNVGLLMELDAITAVAIGGTQLSGGVGSLQGTVIGVVVLGLLSNGMNLMNVTPFVQTAVKGILLMLVVALQSRKKIGL